MQVILTEEEFVALKADSAKLAEEVAKARKVLAARIREAYTQELCKLSIRESPEHYLDPVVSCKAIKSALGRADKVVDSIQ